MTIQPIDHSLLSGAAQPSYDAARMNAEGQSFQAKLDELQRKAAGDTVSETTGYAPKNTMAAEVVEAKKLREACEGFGCGGAAADALTHAGGGELRRAWKLVGLAVLSGGHAVSWVYVCGQAQIRFPALVADEAAFGVLGEASVHTGADGLADAGCGLVGVLSARPLVMLEAEPV